MARYALAEHVFVCVAGEHLVLLDVKADRYWSVEAARTAGLGALVPGWPVRDRRRGSLLIEHDPHEIDDVVEIFRRHGLLAEGSVGGKDAAPVVAETPVTELICDTAFEGPNPGSGWLRFLAASLTAKLILRLAPFEGVIRRVRCRRQSAPSTSLDVERARRLVESFVRHRVFLFSSRDECLFDSLALLEFLATHGLYPDWVFGIQTRPFAAHCWVQHGGTVFNDTAEHVSGYTPIMIVRPACIDSSS